MGWSVSEIFFWLKIGKITQINTKNTKNITREKLPKPSIFLLEISGVSQVMVNKQLFRNGLINGKSPFKNILLICD